MEASNDINILSQKTYPSSKLMSMESSLQQTLINFKGFSFFYHPSTKN